MTDTVVSSGQTSNGLILSAGDTLTVLSGGAISGTTINSGGSATVSVGATASATTLNSGGTAIILGSAGGTAVNSSSSETVSAGGSDQNGAINGGSQSVFGSVGGIALNGGSQTIQSGGSAGGVTINTGGVETVLSGGIASGSTINASGSQVISAGGSGQNATLNNGTLSVFGTVSGTTLNAGGATVQGGGSASGTRVNSSTSETILSGGIGISALVSGGLEDVFGTASSTKVDAGRQLVESGGSASGTTVNSGGSASVIAGGSALSTTINSGGLVTVFSGGSAGGTTVNSGGNATVSAGGSAVSTTLNSGGSATVLSGGGASVVTINAGGSETVSSGGTTTNPVIQGSGAVLTLQSGAIVISAVGFSGSGGRLAIGDTTSQSYIVSGYVSGDTIDLTSLAFDSSGTATLGASNVLKVVESGGSATINLDPTQNFNGLAFKLSADSGSGTQITEELCFCRGTMIRTALGDKPIETLQIGERVQTLGGGLQPIVWIGFGQALIGRANKLARPIVVARDALADGVPWRDLYLTHGHALYLDDVLIPVEHLVNHRSIRWDTAARAVEYYHLELADHDVVFANGVAAETYYDANNRAWFQNTRPGSTPGSTPRIARLSAARTCAPVLTTGALVEAAWARLFERAGGQIATHKTLDPDLHLVVDGQRIDPVADDDGHLVFTVQFAGGRPAAALLRSRSGVPSLLGRSRSDHRPLGVAIELIAVEADAGAVFYPYDAALFRDGGCHRPEDGFCWTDGEFLMPARLFAGLGAGCRLVVHLRRHDMSYPLAGVTPQPRRRSV